MRGLGKNGQTRLKIEKTEFVQAQTSGGGGGGGGGVQTRKNVYTTKAHEKLLPWQNCPTPPPSNISWFINYCSICNLQCCEVCL